MSFAGVDVGSSTVKAVIVDRHGAMRASALRPTGGNYRDAAAAVLESALDQAGLAKSDLEKVVSTGFGAAHVPGDHEQVTEVGCQGKSLITLFPTVRTVIDVGGQQTRVLRLDPEGRVLNFALSEKCATGSGRFMQVIARVLQIELDEIGPLSLTATKPVSFTTGCAVFAESEVISRVAEGWSKQDILAGVHQAVAAKIGNLVIRVRLERECAMTGGGALDVGLVQAVAEKIGTGLLVPAAPQLTAAFGAALIARDRAS